MSHYTTAVCLTATCANTAADGACKVGADTRPPVASTSAVSVAGTVRVPGRKSGASLHMRKCLSLSLSLPLSLSLYLSLSLSLSHTLLL